MKKFLCILLAITLLMTIALSGCGEDDSGDEKQSSVSNSNSAQDSQDSDDTQLNNKDTGYKMSTGSSCFGTNGIQYDNSVKYNDTVYYADCTGLYKTTGESVIQLDDLNVVCFTTNGELIFYSVYNESNEKFSLNSVNTDGSEKKTIISESANKIIPACEKDGVLYYNDGEFCSYDLSSNTREVIDCNFDNEKTLSPSYVINDKIYQRDISYIFSYDLSTNTSDQVRKEGFDLYPIDTNNQFLFEWENVEDDFCNVYKTDENNETKTYIGKIYKESLIDPHSSIFDSYVINTSDCIFTDLNTCTKNNFTLPEGVKIFQALNYDGTILLLCYSEQESDNYGNIDFTIYEYDKDSNTAQNKDFTFSRYINNPYSFIPFTIGGYLYYPKASDEGIVWEREKLDF